MKFPFDTTKIFFEPRALVFASALQTTPVRQSNYLPGSAASRPLPAPGIIHYDSVNLVMLIQQQQQGSKGKFFVEQDGRELAEMTYTIPSPDLIIIDHTEVSDELAGKKVGLQLVTHAVEYVRTTNLKILPLCPFAKSVFDKKPEFGDVLFKRH